MVAPRGLFIPTRFDLNAARRDLEQLKATGKRVGSEAGDLLVKNLRSELQRKIGVAKEALNNGLINKAELRKISADATKELNAGISAGLKQLRKEGKENTEEFSRLQRALKTVGTEARHAGQTGAQSFSLMGKASSVLRNALGGIAAYFTARAIGRFFGDSIKEAEEASRVWTNLEGAVENAGVSFDRVRPRIEAAAKAVQASTRFSDEQYAEALTEVISITNDYTGAVQNMDVVLDLAARKKIDLVTAAQLVGKAMVGETGTLARYGIVVRDGADAIELMRERMRGAAEQDGKSLAGQLQRLRNEWADIKEAVGEATLANDSATASVASLADALEKLEGWVKRNHNAFAGIISIAAGFGRHIGALVEEIESWVDGAGRLAGAEIASIKVGIDLEDPKQVLARYRIALREVQALGARKEQLRIPALFSPIAKQRRDAVIEQLEAETEVVAFLEQAYIRATNAAGELSDIPPPKPRPKTDEQIAAEKRAIEERKRAAEELARIQHDITERAFALNHTAVEEALRALDQLEAEAEEKAKAAGKTVSDAFREQLGKIREDVKLGGTIDELQEQFSRLSKLKPSAESFAALEEMRARVLALRDGIDQNSDRWKQLDGILGQVADRMKSIEAEALIADVKAVFDATMLDLREQAARGVIDQAKFKEEARKAGETLKRAILAVIDRLRKEGKLTVEVETVLVGAAEDAGNAGGSGPDPNEERIRNLREQARVLEENARAALQLAEAFGLIDSEAAQAIQTVVQLATSVARIAAGDFTAIPSAIASVASLVTSFGGDKERAAIIESNTQALKDLAAELAGFRVTGEVVERATRAIDKALAIRSPNEGQDRKLLQRNMEKLGLSMADLDRIAKDLGITIRDKEGRLVREGLEQLSQALKDQAELINGFRLTPDDQRRSAEMEADILDRADDSNAKLAREINLLARFMPSLQETIAGIDTSTPEGRAEVEALVRSLFAQFQAGTLNLEDLTRDEFLEIIQNLESALDEGGVSGTGENAEGFSVVRTITEVTANRLVGVLTTIAALEKLVAENTGRLVQLFGGTLSPAAATPPADVTQATADVVTVPAPVATQPVVPPVGAPAVLAPTVAVPRIEAPTIAVQVDAADWQDFLAALTQAETRLAAIVETLRAARAAMPPRDERAGSLLAEAEERTASIAAEVAKQRELAALVVSIRKTEGELLENDRRATFADEIAQTDRNLAALEGRESSALEQLGRRLDDLRAEKDALTKEMQPESKRRETDEVTRQRRELSERRSVSTRESATEQRREAIEREVRSVESEIRKRLLTEAVLRMLRATNVTAQERAGTRRTADGGETASGGENGQPAPTAPGRRAESQDAPRTVARVAGLARSADRRTTGATELRHLERDVTERRERLATALRETAIVERLERPEEARAATVRAATEAAARDDIRRVETATRLTTELDELIRRERELVELRTAVITTSTTGPVMITGSGNDARVAQQAEHRSPKPAAEGSTPSPRAATTEHVRTLTETTTELVRRLETAATEVEEVRRATSVANVLESVTSLFRELQAVERVASDVQRSTVHTDGEADARLSAGRGRRDIPLLRGDADAAAAAAADGVPLPEDRPSPAGVARTVGDSEDADAGLPAVPAGRDLRRVPQPPVATGVEKDRSSTRSADDENAAEREAAAAAEATTTASVLTRETRGRDVSELGTDVPKLGTEPPSITRERTEREVLTQKVSASFRELAAYERMSADNTARIVALMGPPAPTGHASVPAAALAPRATDATSAAASTFVLNFNENAIGPFNLPDTTKEEAENVGKAVGRGFLDVVDRGLGDRSVEYRRARGLR